MKKPMKGRSIMKGDKPKAKAVVGKQSGKTSDGSMGGGKRARDRRLEGKAM